MARNHPMRIVLREARPTLDEGRVFARYLDTAAEGFFRYLLGRCSSEIIAEVFKGPDNDYSYQNVVFAEHDNVIVGMASGYTAEQHRGFTDSLKEAAGKSTLRMSIVSALFAPLLRFLSTYTEGDFYLQAIAVDESVRGRGVGTLLLDAIEDRAHASGSARLALDVSAKNGGARRLYERREMRVESGWPKLPLIPPVDLRMVKSL